MDFNSLNDGDWQNFLYLLLVLVAMAAGLFSRRDFAFSKIIKYLAIWSIFGLFSIGLYAYRFELSNVKNRILGEINPSQARVEKSGEIVINLSQDGHFYINTKINGSAVKFMIDTGASDIMINASEAQKIGIDLKKLRFDRPYQTANGRSWGAEVILDELVVGNIKFRNISASVNNADMGISLLGMSFLRQFKKYEFYQDRLVLVI